MRGGMAHPELLGWLARPGRVAGWIRLDREHSSFRGSMALAHKRCPFFLGYGAPYDTTDIGDCAIYSETSVLT